MALTIFLIVAPIVTILVFWRYRPKSMRPKDKQTDFFKELDEDKTTPWEDTDDSPKN